MPECLAWLLAKKRKVGLMMCCWKSDSPLAPPVRACLLMVFTCYIWLDGRAGLRDQRSRKRSPLGPSALSFPEAEIHCTHLGSAIWRQSMSLYEQRPWGTVSGVAGPPMLACALFLAAKYLLPLNKSLMWTCSLESWELFQILKLWLFKGTNRNNPNFILWRNFKNYVYTILYVNVLDICLLVYIIISRWKIAFILEKQTW